MPALRDRPEDVPLYVDAFLNEARDAGLSLALDPTTIAQLAAQPWPGNVRELRNALERAAALGEIAPPPGAGGPGSAAGEAGAGRGRRRCRSRLTPTCRSRWPRGS